MALVLFSLEIEYTMIVLNVVLLTISLFICEAAFVDNLTKCSVKDNECMKGLYQKVIHDIGKTGIAELNIPPIDPMKITNFSVNVLDDLTLTMTDGVAKGIRNCIVNSFAFDIEKQTETQEITCESLTIKGQFVISGSSPTIRTFLGTDSINGNGRAKVKLEKLTISFVVPAHPVRKDDGQIYIVSPNKNIKYKYDIGKAHFVTEKVFIGKDDISQLVSNYLNGNWKSVLKSFGKVFMDKAMEIYISLNQNFFGSVPAIKYLIEDLTPYVKN